MPIRVLSPEVISQISAGEVVERPASVVKELVENSLDAGATQISIEVHGGGVSFIRVSDNGIGIPSHEVELAFQRYATSKISSSMDLRRIASLGFRGEALPSIATVAQVDVVTRSREEEVGTYLSLRGGNVVEKGMRGCPPGTNVIVRNLFREVPARLKFLKSLATENSHIVDLVSQYSLAFPEVKFLLLVDKREVLRTPGNGNLREVLVQVHGLELAQAMLGIDKKDLISGFVAPPSFSRSSRSHLTFFVNRRWVQNRMLARAVEEACRERLMAGRFPIAVINLSLSPQDIDVNVHPTKREVKFRQEQAVFATVFHAVREALIQTPLPRLEPQPSFHPPPAEVRRAKPAAVAPPSPPLPPMPILRVVGQLANTYIIAEGPDGLYLIDQHAAHERVLFERILSQRVQQAVEIQGLLEPLTIELSPREEELLRKRGETLSQFGFTIEPFGGRTYLVRAIPSLLGSQEIAPAIREVLDSPEADAASPKWEEKVAFTLACHGAVRAGQVLNQEEMKELVRQLEQTDSPRTCPHGRPTMVHLSSWQLEKEFGRS